MTSNAPSFAPESAMELPTSLPRYRMDNPDRLVSAAKVVNVLPLDSGNTKLILTHSNVTVTPEWLKYNMADVGDYVIISGWLMTTLPADVFEKIYRKEP